MTITTTASAMIQGSGERGSRSAGRSERKSPGSEDGGVLMTDTGYSGKGEGRKGEGGREKEEGRRRKGEGGREKEEGRRRKGEGGREKEEGRRRKGEGGREKEEGTKGRRV